VSTNVWRGIIIAIGAALIAVGLWIGSELHYESCVDAASAKYAAQAPAAYAARYHAVRGCSRFPF
jgi:hypothetical protein